MAYTTVNNGSLFMNPTLYTGTGSTLNITGVGFQPDLVWLKKRSAAGNHYLFDVVRGAQKNIHSNENFAEVTEATTLTAFGSDGFTLSTDGGVNQNGATFVSWNWKAGTAVSGNTGGGGTYKTYTGSVNTTAGFSIIKYTGNGAAGHTIPHHLGAAPTFRITKNLNSVSDWPIYNEVLGNTKEIKFTQTAAGTTTNYWNSTSPNATNFTLGTNGISNENGSELISYNFTPIQGYSKFETYTGNGSTDGPFIYTGFSPAFVMIKRTNTSNNWIMFDNKRDPFNEATRVLFPNNNNAEDSDTSVNDLDFLSNGIKIREDNGEINGSGDSYIYMAFAEAPLVGTNNIPANAR